MTQQNAAMVEESTAASHNLTTQTVKLRQTLATFTIGSAHNLKAVQGGQAAVTHEGTSRPQIASQKSRTPMLTSQHGAIQQDGKILPTHSDDEAGWDHF